MKNNPILNYQLVLSNYNFLTYILNSLFVSTAGAFLCVLICLLAAYYFYKSNSVFSKFLLTLIIISFLFPQEAKIIFNFTVIKNLDLIDKLIAVFLPFISNLFTLLLFIQAFKFYSSDIDDYTELEGFNVFQKIFLIQIPILKNYCITAFFANFLNLWNDFLWPLVVLQTDEKYTVQVGISYISRSLIFEPTYFAAAITVSILIPIVIFLFFQKYFN
ncbi:MAG: carbohydrate ABC transporter permease [Candidatus Calescibacterium sp.]|nr:carbohydrate ABC transporter permease [Candidatus Calescibacterium sp.]MCX7972009.1 carbohydrate ABC transporter permease [bacterium]MDW8194707.1 carbohydrate ABC transporter permease [Candidatus Calescibacterium sp.]